MKTAGKAMPISCLFVSTTVVNPLKDSFQFREPARKEAKGLFWEAVNLGGNKAQRDHFYQAYLKPLKIQWCCDVPWAWRSSLQEGRKYKLITVTAVPQGEGLNSLFCWEASM